MPFNSFPYVNLNDVNLDWILKRIQSLGTDVDALNQFMQDLNIPEAVQEQLAEWLNDGTLDAIINSVRMFVPDSYSQEAYKAGTLLAIASWLINEQGSTSVMNPSEVIGVAQKCYFRYNDTGKSYDTLFQTYTNQADSFTYSDTYDGLPVVYMNCAAMLSMITKGRQFQNSPNYYAFTALSYDQDEALARCWEIGTSNDNEWTIDFLNNIFSARMGNIMESSGCTLHVLRKPLETEFDENVFSTMETGDLVFFGWPDNNPGSYLGIAHCAYFIKDLADLDTAALPYKARFQAVQFADYMDPAHGFIFHCHGSTTPGFPYQDVIRIETLDHATFNYYNQHTVYVCKPYSNALNSNKALRKLTGTFHMGDSVLFGVGSYGAENVTPRHPATFNAQVPERLEIENPALHGVDRTNSYSNLNALADGLVQINNFNTISNGVATAESTGLLWQLGSHTDTRTQIFIEQTSGRILYRQRNASSVWTEWKSIPHNPANDVFLNGSTVDLDTYRGYDRAGVYAIEVGVTLTNAPAGITNPTGVRWILEVVAPQHSSGMTIQTLSNCYTTPKKYERVWSGSAWSAWSSII